MDVHMEATSWMDTLLAALALGILGGGLWMLLVGVKSMSEK